MNLFFKNMLAIAVLGVNLISPGCDLNTHNEEEQADTIFNLNHLDSLGEVIEYGGQEFRIIHIYADAPDYQWVGDDDEGEACVDDAARAAVVYLRHFELTGNQASAEKAKQLLRFIGYMQTDEGYFYNFVWDNTLRINKTHQNSLANEINWWAARAVWALGTGARVLAEYDPEFAAFCLAKIDNTLPRIEEMLTAYPKTQMINGYEMPTWLIGGTGADASSELLLGLTEARIASDERDYSSTIGKLAEGIAMMQYGTMSTPPYGAHLSWEGGWHGWGNSQTMAVVQAGYTTSAKVEADQFYPLLLVDGWAHSFPLDNPENKRYYEQIAYATRGVAVGLIRLYEATNEDKYAIMAGLAGSWFTGNNAAQTSMYNPLYGYGYDGINGPNDVNKNAGAESTIEALFTILELEQYPLSRKWMYAQSGDRKELTKNAKTYFYREFWVRKGNEQEKIVLMLNPDDSEYELLNQNEFDSFITFNN